MQVYSAQGNNYNPQFNGYLDTSRIKIQRGIWNKVEKKFSQDNLFSRGGLRIEYDMNKRLFVRQIGGDWIEYFTQKGTEKLMSQKPEVIADTFTKLHRFIDENDCVDEVYYEQKNLWNKMQKKFPALRTKVMKEFLTGLMNEGLQIAMHAEHQKRFSFYKKDPFLKDLLTQECDPIPNQAFNIKKTMLDFRMKTDK